MLCYASAAHSFGSKPQEQKLEHVEVVHQGSTCGALSQSQWLTEQQKYEVLQKSLMSNVIAGNASNFPAIDFSRRSLLVISMGQQRTGGYSVRLASSQLDVVNDRASVHVNWISPKPGMITIQMLSNPCLLLSLPKGNYKFVDIVDQTGKIKQSLTTSDN